MSAAIDEEKIGHPDSDWIGATVIEDKPTRAGNWLVTLLCILFVLSVLAYGAVDVWALGLQTIGAALVGFLWLWDAAARGELRFSRSALQLPILALILIGFVQLLPLRDVSPVNQILKVPASASLTMDASATWFFLVQLFIYLIYFAAALTFINEQKQLRKATVAIVLFGFAIAIFSIIQSFSSEGAIYWSRTHPAAAPFGTYINRHHFGALMEMTIALSLGLVYAGAVEKELRAIQLFAVFVMCVALLMTGSRGAVLSLLGIIGFLTLLNLKNRKRGESDEKHRSRWLQKLTPIVGGLLIVLTIFGVVLYLGGETELSRGIGLSRPDDLSTGRLHFWQTTFQVVRDNPILGVGLDALGQAYTRYDTSSGVFRLERAHNDYLQILAEAGIFGFLCLVAFVFLLFRRGYQIVTTTRDTFRRGVALGALAGCFGIAVHSFFDFPLRTPANALVFLLLAVLATVQISYPKLHRRRNK